MTSVEKSSVRRSVTTQRGQALVVTLAPEGAWIRERGRRTAYLMPYGVAYQQAARMAVDAQRRERKAKRRAVR
ncbi:MAG TPA: hypothetical protein VFH61_18895 [Thermoleophilia bacterium]|nr:hypothetical protein [Thermoleophilia bacterium]